ncbi:MAG: tetratricopeptide repeat protein [Pseudomonadota bacterium]
MVGLRGSDKVEKYLKKALRERESGNWAEAQEFCKKVIKLEPGHPQANHFLGESYSRLHDYGKALKHLQLAQDLLPNSPAIQNAMGNVFLGMADYDKALSCYQRALALNPNWPETHFNLGTIYKKIGRFNDAIRHFQVALNLNPQWAQAHDNLARLLEAQGRTDDAIVHYQEAVRLDATNLSAKHHLAALSGENPDAPPKSYLMEIFDANAEQFDHYLVNVLGCQIPQLLRRSVDGLSGGAAHFGNAMDLGCGTGLAGQAFRDVCEHLSGIDLAPCMIEEAKKKGIYDELLTGEIPGELSRVQRRYDLFIASDLFVYIGNLSEIFSEVARHAAPGAWFVFSTEISVATDFSLLPTGRYAHSTDYIEQLAKANDFSIDVIDCGDLRKEKGDWIKGNIYVLKYAG